ncbi:DUF3939 domain-containing protein [Gracilibacillus sp. S3-1-1]|uniref:DUF3939 domain-containing protein n=1 Tax=Gracilibacillus pellucidus TaxID=3095368 RepID=A0ACC6M4B4_9BACI|nr:DUF3939 domain-containing protein [Gracilibacillus sp. S3-1-1]MDX8045738.1 DUF3939 domain-containing protein [Gracilibacillus sp. S3-1-1]
MWFKKRKDKKEKFPTKAISLEEVRSAIHTYSKDLPPNIPLKILIQDDLSLDYTLLAPILKAIPEKNYYMSKETYDLFEEEDKHIAHALDQVQQAVDQYIAQTKELPVIDHDPYRKVNFFKLEQLNLINERPEMDFYITDQEQLVTTEKPK